MADRLIRAQVTIPMDSGIPEDAVVNTLYFDDDDDPVWAPSDTYDAVVALVQGFYQAIDGVLFPSTVGPTATVRLYDMRQPMPRIPVHQATFAITPTASKPLPQEVALCMSFAAEAEAGANPRRRRGRLFLGPVADVAATFNLPYSRPEANVRTAIAAAAATLKAGTFHTGSPGLDLKWAIYSPTTDATSSIDDAFHDVASGWIDDTWDTQRRRGPEATTRTTF